MFTNTMRALKKSSTSDWSVILNPISGEIAKNEAVQKIVEVFPITAGEAEELVERTPLILLESLSEEDANRVREHFARAHVDLMISNDNTLRRRCYRTVWPEPPSLDFTKLEIPKPKPVEKESFTREVPRIPAPSVSRSPVKERLSLTTDGDYFKPIAKKNDLIDPSTARYSFESSQESPRTFERSSPNVSERDNLIDELKDKLFTAQKRASELQEENKKLEHSLEETEKEKTARLSVNNLETQRRSFDSLSLEYEKKQMLLEEKVEELTEERGQLVSELSRFRSKLAEVETERNRSATEQETLLRKITFREKELDELKGVVERQQRMEDENKQLRIRYEDLVQESEERYKQYRTVEDEKRSAEMRAEQLADEIERIKKEREEEMLRFREELEMLRKKLKDFDVFKTENKSLQDELKSARERLKEFTVNREQQEAITKRLRLQNELIEKEARLKELVKKQEIIEREIVERGQVVQQVLSEQEEIEREIVRAKQAQKYISEQIKSREKPSLRARGRLEVKSPEAVIEESSDI